MKELNIKIQENEHWYGLCVDYGRDFPLSVESDFDMNFNPNPTQNQASPFIVSSHGRYIWCDTGFNVTLKNGIISINSGNISNNIEQADILLFEGYKNLRSAFIAASKKFFPSNGKLPPKDFFTKPQYNTWIELIYNQNQKDIIKYAKSILENGLPAGILMIDDSWSYYYGKWKFNPHTFPEPKLMVDELHQLGFKVMLWTCPFISPDTVEYRYLKDRKYLVMNKDGEPAIREWWNGHSAILDFTNPKAIEWYHEQNLWLMDTYGIDGFKLDAGDARYYRNDDITFAPCDANRQSQLWAEFGQCYEYNEYRACFKCAGLALVQRLADKNHSWDGSGIASLIPNQLAQGILGYAYTCPDMIGGGQYGSFLSTSTVLDEELFVRYAQCAALMPMMQFSAAPWRVLSKENAELCNKAAKLHCEFSEYIYELAEKSKISGEPITRYMEYQFPNQGLATINDQFMLGDKILVAPIYKKGEYKRTVSLPKGSWKYVNGTIYKGGSVIEVSVPLDTLAYFTFID